MGCGSSAVATSSSSGKNMLQKYYSPEVAKKFAAHKTKHGMTMEQVVRSGVENPDSSIGVYAGDPESYEMFSEFFDKIIRDYHKIPADKPIKSVHDFSPCSLPNLDPSGKRIVSTRVRVARNLKAYAFPALISVEERVKSCGELKEVLESLEGELAGKYYPLEGMAEEDRVKLVQDHFLFKKGDRFLESAGINRDWPTGRGIFHNNDKTFLVWTHEEDVLRVISMQPGGDVAAVFNRLVAGLNALNQKCEFAQSPLYGFLTSCPTNLGTSMRASVHLRIPLVSKQPGFEDMCRSMGLSVRGIDGEHSESSDGTYDISNRGRLGRTEHEYLNDLHQGVMKLIAMEEELEANAKKNMLQKYYTAEVTKQYAGVKSKHGMTIEQVVRSGVENPDSSIGVYAGDPESYTVFGDFFAKIIRDYHKIPADKPIKSVHDLSPSTLTNLDPSGNRIVSTRVRVARNLKEYAFPALISVEERVKSCGELKEVLESLEGELAGKYYPLEGMAEEDRVKLVQDHFLFKKGDRFLESAGINRDWPTGRGIFHNNDKTFLVWTHEEDVLRVISMQPGGDVAAVFNRLVAGLDALNKKCAFAQSDAYGFLTSCPTNLGTSMRASVHVRIPLVSKQAGFEDMCREMGLSVRGIDGEHSESADGIYDISNRGRLGKTEREYLQTLHDGVTKLIAMEEELEKKGTAAQ